MLALGASRRHDDVCSCFQGSDVEEVKLCDRCFQWCLSLYRVTFGSSSSLERIGTLCFSGSGLIGFGMPSTVRAIGGGAFSECSLSGGFIYRDGCRFRALDGLVLSHDCELCCGRYGVLSSVCIPDGVRELCEGCFQECRSLRRLSGLVFRVFRKVALKR